MCEDVQSYDPKVCARVVLWEKYHAVTHNNLYIFPICEYPT